MSTIYLKSEYSSERQILLAEEIKPPTAFTILSKELMQFTMLLFGLHLAAAVFQ
jgi:hypothetical protein